MADPDTLPLEILIEIFGHYLTSFHGRGRFIDEYHVPAPLPKAEGAAAPKVEATVESSPEAAPQVLGPMALFLVSKRISEIARIVTLNTAWHIFGDADALGRYLDYHTKQGTARHLRSITVCLRCGKHSVNLISDIADRLHGKFGLSTIRRVDILATHLDLSNRGEAAWRTIAFKDLATWRRILPHTLKEYTIHWCQFEEKLQYRLNSSICARCCRIGAHAGPQWLRLQHTCSSELTPITFERLSREEQLALVDRARGVYDRWPTVPLHAYVQCVEYGQWKALERLNRDLMATVRGEQEFV